ncbi:MAG TPA: hypothetical protein VI146_05440 [Nitrososphaeraceae archaeon]
MKDIKIKIETLNGTNLVNDNEVNVINSGIASVSRDGADPRIWIRDVGSDLVEITIKLDAVNIAKLIECANSQ